MNVKTSNIITTIDTATSGPIERTTIGGAAGTSSNIDTIPITTFTITITITTITITISIIKNMTGTTSVIIKILSDAGEIVSEVITIIAITQIIQIRI